MPLRRRLRSAERLSDCAIARALGFRNTADSRSSASLRRVTSADQYRVPRLGFIARTRIARVGEISERHEVRVGSGEHTFVFIADSRDGRLIIREEKRGAKDVCSLTLANPDELRDFFEGLRRVLVATGHAAPAAVPGEAAAAPPRFETARRDRRPPPAGTAGGEDREAAIAEARQRNPHAFEPWTPDEERQVRERFQRGETVDAIARAHRRSPRAIEMRLQKMGLIPAQ